MIKTCVGGKRGVLLRQCQEITGKHVHGVLVAERNIGCRSALCSSPLSSSLHCFCIHTDKEPRVREKGCAQIVSGFGKPSPGNVRAEIWAHFRSCLTSATVQASLVLWCLFVWSSWWRCSYLPVQEPLSCLLSLPLALYSWTQVQRTSLCAKNS